MFNTETAMARGPLFEIPGIGFTDLDGIAFWNGLNQGLWGEDLSGLYDGCLNGWPDLAEDIRDIVEDAMEIAEKPDEEWPQPEEGRPDLDALYPYNKTVYAILQMVQKLCNLLFDAARQGPRNVASCSLLINTGWSTLVRFYEQALSAFKRVPKLNFHIDVLFDNLG